MLLKFNSNTVPYNFEKETEIGTFYRGRGNIVWLHNATFTWLPYGVYEGGIWMPKSGGAPRLYKIVGAKEIETKSLESIDTPLRQGQAATCLEWRRSTPKTQE
ncbi:protein of unknown function [Georgfuchsia toluolica]|uniref:Uncharacterized protein n=1 Tax=Georgfuchsia toluolica TaxID=424218 RepID=A0A916N920_9PROT|nr:protein of unknown function [Georgfuchsia toluolica]